MRYLKQDMDKERRALQLTKAYITAVKRLEEGVDQDLVLIPFSQDEKVEVHTTSSDGVKTITIVNAP
jgi:hypothetical protein